MLTKTTPAAWAGVTAVICEGLTTVRLVAAIPPKVTVVAPVRFVPIITTFVSPVFGPDVGVMFENVTRLVEVEL